MLYQRESPDHHREVENGRSISRGEAKQAPSAMGESRCTFMSHISLGRVLYWLALQETLDGLLSNLTGVVEEFSHRRAAQINDSSSMRECSTTECAYSDNIALQWSLSRRRARSRASTSAHSRALRCQRTSRIRRLSYAHNDQCDKLTPSLPDRCRRVSLDEALQGVASLLTVPQRRNMGCCSYRCKSIYFLVLVVWAIEYRNVVAPTR